ncbi:MAG: CapA family protein [Minisyncoccia bacterium]|jgi:poly-gamma-glutamate synthesis protein (capsule biosynthesis protein)
MNPHSSILKIFLCGDVMTGRGIDQILPYPSDPKLKESFVKDARDYIRFAEEVNGKIEYPVSFDYIWGDALKELEKEKVDVRIINLETTITTSNNFLPKGINYRMNPKNIDILKVFKVDVACLANNHILDFGEEGLLETIETLKKNGILTVGAGKNIKEASKPAAIKIDPFRKVRIESEKVSVIIFNYADVSSGIPIWWKAEKNKAGVNLITDKREFEYGLTFPQINTDYNTDENGLYPRLSALYPRSSVVIFSIHWGPNWGYEISEEERNFAHRLIDEVNVDIVFGHSSHHFKGIETYKGKLIIYGAGDFINDYEGIGGYEEFRGDLVLGYVVEIENLKINKLILLPFRIKKFRLNYCTDEEIDWIFNVLKRESKIEGRMIKEDKRIVIELNS